VMERILAVDDEKNILMLISNALEKDGYVVDTVADSREVLNLALPQYSLILLDVMMPGLDGYTLCEKVRSSTDCPILFLTARTDEADVMKGLGIGADDYITKPFGIGELRARVQAHLRREGRKKRHLLTVAGMQFLLQEKKALYEGREIPLTKSEYAICEYLALHQGQVFSKERIYEHVFGYEKDSDSTAITEHIKNIRSKCQAVGAAPIETVWGIGYRWK